MPDVASSALAAWSNFYVIAGSSAGALTGLMFVVITLVMGLERSRRSPDGIATFSTPTVLHFCVALFVSVVLAAPWHSLARAATLIGLTGLYGVVYVLNVLRRTRRLTIYVPEAEDWIWYTILPLIAYVTIVASAMLLVTVPEQVLFALAGAVVLLIFIGIHNAWDIVTYIAIGGLGEPEAQAEAQPQPAPQAESRE